jgi:hypothetical protein
MNRDWKENFCALADGDRARLGRSQPAPSRLALVANKHFAMEDGKPFVFGARARRTAPEAGAVPISSKLARAAWFDVQRSAFSVRCFCFFK